MHNRAMTAAVVLSLPLVGVISAACLAQGQAKPAATVRTFVQAVSASDSARAAACVVDGKPAMAAIVSGQVARMGGYLKFKGVKEKVAGSSAVVTATGVTGEKGKTETEPFRSVVKLRKVGASWRIVAPGPEFARRNRKASADIVNYLAVFVSNPSALSAAQGTAAAAECLSHTKQLAVACLMLAADHDGRLALTPATMTQALLPYVKNRRLFACPAGGGYSVNPAVAGKRLKAIGRPGETVLLYEGAKGKLSYSHQGMACVAFVDGHCVRMTKQQAARLRWKP